MGAQNTKNAGKSTGRTLEYTLTLYRDLRFVIFVSRTSREIAWHSKTILTDFHQNLYTLFASY